MMRLWLAFLLMMVGTFDQCGFREIAIAFPPLLLWQFFVHFRKRTKETSRFLTWPDEWHGKYTYPTIDGKRTKNTWFKTLNHVASKNRTPTWFPDGKVGFHHFLDLIKKNNGKKAYMFSRLLHEMNIDCTEMNALMDELANYNKWTKWYIIGDPTSKRDIDVFGVVTFDVKVGLLSSELERLINDVQDTVGHTFGVVTEDHLDICLINIDEQYNITDVSKGSKQFGSLILGYTCSLNQQKYPFVCPPLYQPGEGCDEILKSEVFDMDETIIKKVLDALNDMFLDAYNQTTSDQPSVAQQKTIAYNSLFSEKKEIAIRLMEVWLKSIEIHDRELTTKQQEVLKSVTFKILQMIIWSYGIVGPNFFTKEGVLDLVIGLGFQLDKDKLMQVLYIKPGNNKTTDAFRPIWELYKDFTKDHKMDLPGVNPGWNTEMLVQNDSHPVWPAVVDPEVSDEELCHLWQYYLDPPMKPTEYLGQFKFSLLILTALGLHFMRSHDWLCFVTCAIPFLMFLFFAIQIHQDPDSDKLKIQHHFSEENDSTCVDSLKKTFEGTPVEVKGCGQQTQDWFQVLNDPQYEFGKNSGIKQYKKIPSWQHQLKDFRHLVVGCIAEKWIQEYFPFDKLFPNATFMTIGALIAKTSEKPYRGVAPDGLLVFKDDQGITTEIIPIEIKKIDSINLDDRTNIKDVKHKIDLAIRQLCTAKKVINSCGIRFSEKMLLILHDVVTGEVFWKLY